MLAIFGIIVYTMTVLLIRPVGQAVKTPPSHGGNRGSIPLQAVIQSIGFTDAFFVVS